jgi:uncharacterized protein (DUF2236 family)
MCRPGAIVRACRARQWGVATLRDISAEALLLAGGGAAILLQVADPAIAVGVAQHSDFASRPLDRLHGTLTYLYVSQFGTAEGAAAIARQVGAAHRPVQGAQDEQLQLWVAATLYWTAIEVHELVLGDGVGASDAESAAGASLRDDQRVLREFATVGTALGMPRSLWPVDTAAFAAYWARRQGGLEVGEDARRVARDLLHPSNAPWWMRRLMPTVRLATTALLPAPLRDAYGLELDERRWSGLLRFARAVYPRLPRAVRHAPLRRYLRAYRRSVTLAR